jgi:hypothetical protein
MAMTKCKECGGPLSTKADACPGCGARPKKPQDHSTVLAGVVALVVIVGLAGRCSSNTSTPTPTASAPATATHEQAAPAEVVTAPHDVRPAVDDLSHFVSKYGQPDRVRSSETEKPRPPIVTKQLVYKKEHVRVVYVANVPVGTPPPYASWKLLGFQDERTNDVLRPAEVVHRLAGRLKQE